MSRRQAMISPRRIALFLLAAAFIYMPRHCIFDIPLTFAAIELYFVAARFRK